MKFIEVSTLPIRRRSNSNLSYLHDFSLVSENFDHNYIFSVHL